MRSLKSRLLKLTAVDACEICGVCAVELWANNSGNVICANCMYVMPSTCFGGDLVFERVTDDYIREDREEDEEEI